MANAGCWWNLTDPFDGFLLGKRYVLMDRDTKFCPAFRNILRDEGAEPLLLPPRSPNLNAHLERFMRSLKSECLHRMIFFGEKSLRRAIYQYLDHFHTERNHQGLSNQIIQPGDEVGSVVGKIESRERLGGTPARRRAPRWPTPRSCPPASPARAAISGRHRGRWSGRR